MGPSLIPDLPTLLWEKIVGENHINIVEGEVVRVGNILDTPNWSSESKALYVIVESLLLCHIHSLDWVGNLLPRRERETREAGEKEKGLLAEVEEGEVC